MSIKAGTTLTTAHLSHTTQAVLLTNDSVTNVNTWEQWGTEEVRISNPGVAVEVTAVLSGRLQETTQADVAAFVRLRTSLDGGATWAVGHRIPQRLGTSLNTVVLTGNTMGVTGTPTGDIVVQAEINMPNTSTNAQDATLTATMIPSAA